MEQKKAQALLEKYVAGNCTEAEKALLESWYLQHNLDQTPDMSAEERMEDKQEIMAALNRAIQPKRSGMWLKITAAAAVALLVTGTTLWLYQANRANIHAGTQMISQNDVAPGSNKAVLTLANGQTINLNSDKKGIIIKAGELAYNDGTQIKTDDQEAGLNEKNTVTTPIGGQYQVILEDGTKVWLNAGSSLSYPTHFTGGVRKVEITGEAYFEVAHNKAAPFKVSSKGQTIEVLGTHFNIMAYENEQMVKTTLLEGSVKVADGGSNKALILKPGQQAQFNAQQLSLARNVDIEEVVSWKNGYFKFNEDIKSIMNKIARWYDVEVVYQPGIDLKQTFSGEVSKSRNVSVLLKVMELTGNVNFKVEGRRIIVMP